MAKDFSDRTHEDFVAFDEQRTKVAKEYRAAHAEEIEAEQQQRAVEISTRKDNVFERVNTLVLSLGYKLNGNLDDHMLLMSKPEPKRKDFLKKEDFENAKANWENNRHIIMKRRDGLDPEARRVDIIKTVLEQHDPLLFEEWNVARHW